MSRKQGIRVAIEHIQTVKHALYLHFSCQRNLAEEVRVCLATVQSYLNGKRVSRENFEEISYRLGLDWKEIAADDRLPPPPDSLLAQKVDPDVDALVQQVRQRCYDKIQTLYGKIQLLDVAQPIDIDNLYIDVNILEQISSQQWIEISDLQQGYDSAANDFARLGASRMTQERVPGMEAVKRYNRLMVLGKPGSGKTTFLQNLAIQCNQGKFQAERVPIFIRLRDFTKYARGEANFSLLNFISREFSSCDLVDENVAELILKEGKGLILLDGLDEVPAEDATEVKKELQLFCDYYYGNQLIISCRIGSSPLRFLGFTEVEIADFNFHEIQSFAEKWFVAVAKKNQRDSLAEARQFINKLKRPENQQIRELVVTPILLHLICLVFQAKADFPSNRAKLYEQGLNILLRKWDETRGIYRNEAYRSLTLLRKKQLLCQVALITFEQGDYFFEKDQIQHLIANYMGTFPEINTDLEQLQLDSEAVLKAIEVQHGLLLERARGIYSFSHLTFQEYFAAKQIVNISDLESLKKIVSHITNRRWRDVFLLAAGISRNGDDLLRLIKQQIDRLMASDEKLQQFLIWLHQKSSSISISCKALAVRAFYLVRSHRTLTIGSIYTSNLTRSLAFVINLNDNLALDHDLACTLNCALTCTFYLGLTPERILDRVLALDHAFALAIALDYAIEHACNLELRCEAELSSSSLNKSLQQLKNRLPSIDENEEEFKEWWEFNGQAWTEDLRNAMISYRNIGSDWQFSYQQRKMLWQYFYANQLLVDCLSNCCYITPGIRQEIEDTLLLPIAGIEKKQSIVPITST